MNLDADDEKFRTYDADNSGGLSLEEATSAVTNEGVSAKLRSQFDPNHDGAIDTAETAKFDEMLDASDGLRNFVEVEHIFSL